MDRAWIGEGSDGRRRRSPLADSDAPTYKAAGPPAAAPRRPAPGRRVGGGQAATQVAPDCRRRPHLYPVLEKFRPRITFVLEDFRVYWARDISGRGTFPHSIYSDTEHSPQIFLGALRASIFTPIYSKSWLVFCKIRTIPPKFSSARFARRFHPNM